MRELDRGREIPVARRRAPELRAPRRGEPSRLRRWLLPRRPSDAIVGLLAVAVTIAVFVNALALQDVPHPAPMFAEPSALSKEDRVAMPTVPAAPAPKVSSVPLAAPAPPQRPATGAIPPGNELVLEIQRELASRGYYDGELDGRYGPRTDQAIRDFEEAEGLNSTGEPTEALLGHILQSRARRDVTGSVTGSIPPAEPERSTRVLSVQRLLARLGYGPVSLNGHHDAATRAAIERFEHDRGLPPSGEIDERLLNELAAVSGAPVE